MPTAGTVRNLKTDLTLRKAWRFAAASIISIEGNLANGSRD